MKKAFLLTRALKHTNYRLFFAGQSISLIGTWLTRVATSWLVYKLSASGMVLGWVSFAGLIPTFLFSPMAGVLVDRWNLHRVLIITQILALIQSALLATLTLTKIITIPHIFLLSAFQGFINAFDMPARQSFVVQMVEDRKDLPNAIALNSLMLNMARLVGPSVAGILIAAVGEGGCFTVDALSYVAVIISLVMMKLPPMTLKSSSQKKIWADLRDGLHYSLNLKPIRSILLLLGFVNIVGMPYMVLLPLIVGQQLHGGAHLLGYLTAASGLGALMGVFFLASRKSVLGLGRVIGTSTLIFGIGLMGFATSRLPLLSILLIMLVGLGMMLMMSASNTILQTIVDEDKRGRVMGLYTTAVVGMLPFGSLICGWMADHIGPATTLFGGGVACTLAAVLFFRQLPLLRQIVQPIYQKLGILPKIAGEDS